MIAGAKNSFMACLVLLALPEPTHLGSDILREWPNLLFMSLSFLFLLYGAKTKHSWPFFLVGLFGGISFLIRSESIQIVIFAAIILFIFIIRPSQPNRLRLKALVGGLLLFAGFAFVFMLYSNYSGRMHTRYIETYKAKTELAVSKSTSDFKDTSDNSSRKSLPLFCYEVLKKIGGLLMWFFLPFWIIGLYSRLRYKADDIERVLTIGLISVGLGLILFRYIYIEPLVSNRWCLPFLVLTAFYIPTGIEKTVQWIKSINKQNPMPSEKVVWIMIAIGALICLPKLFKPLGYDKKEYHDAAQWINENTNEKAVIYCFDRRIPFYANRDYFLYRDINKFKASLKADYLLALSIKGKPEIILPQGLELQKNIRMRSADKELLIFKYPRKLTAPYTQKPQG